MAKASTMHILTQVYWFNKLEDHYNCKTVEMEQRIEIPYLNRSYVADVYGETCNGAAFIIEVGTVDEHKDNAFKRWARMDSKITYIHVAHNGQLISNCSMLSSALGKDRSIAIVANIAKKKHDDGDLFRKVAKNDLVKAQIREEKSLVKTVLRECGVNNRFRARTLWSKFKVLVYSRFAKRRYIIYVDEKIDAHRLRHSLKYYNFKVCIRHVKTTVATI